MHNDQSCAGGGGGLEKLAKELRPQCQELIRLKGERLPKWVVLTFSLHAAECIVLLMTLRLIINPIASVRTNLLMFCQYTCILEFWGQEKRAGTGRGSGGRRGGKERGGGGQRKSGKGRGRERRRERETSGRGDASESAQGEAEWGGRYLAREEADLFPPLLQWGE